MSPLEQLDRLRQRIFRLGVILCVPMVMIGALTTDMSWPTATWMLGFSLVMAWMGARRKSLSRFELVLPIAVCVAAGPFACAADGVGWVELATVSLIPVAVSVLFIDELAVVVSTSVVGTVSVVSFFAMQSVSLGQLICVGAVNVGISLVISFAGYTTQRLRELDRKAELEHNQALRLSETRRSHAERLAIVGRLASGVAHEINNPLAFVKANVGSLRRSLVTKDDELTAQELKEILDDTTHGVERICQIVADLKGFAREDNGALEPIDVREVITGSVRLAGVRMPIDTKVKVELPNALPLVRANPRKLAQVVLNLLVNSGEAMEERRVAKPEVSIRGAVEGGVLKLTVTDNGPGIPAPVMERLFEPFFTTKPPGKGTGLGLALSREYVEAFGGTLSAQNAAPQGAQFTIALRISAATGETPLPGSLDLGPRREALLKRHKQRSGPTRLVS